MRPALKWRVANLAMAVMLFGGGTAFAQQDKDAIQAGVSIPAGRRAPVIRENGTCYTPGTYARGMSINKGMSATSLPGGGTAGGTFAGFGAMLSAAGFGCSGAPVSVAAPNPLSAPLAFTIQ